MDKAIKLNEYGDIEAFDSNAMSAFAMNNTFCPMIVRTVFSLKTEETVAETDADGKPIRIPAVDENGNPRLDTNGKQIMCNKKKTVKLDVPILATTCFFEDGTQVTVKNSKHDPIETEKVWLDAGGNVTENESEKKTEVEVATERSKEQAICYAVVKRICSFFDATGEFVKSSANTVLRKIVDNAEDRVLAQAKAKLTKAAKKAAFEKRKTDERKPKAKRYTNADLRQLLGAFLEKAASDTTVIDKLSDALKSRD